MIKIKSNSVQKSIPTALDICKDNLLINADFRYGVINQRARTSYASFDDFDVHYTIDRWCKRNHGTVVTPLTRSVKLSAPDVDAYSGFGMNQVFPDKSVVLGKTVTCTINVKSISGEWRFGLCAMDSVQLASDILGYDDDYGYTITTTGIHTVTINVPSSINREFIGVHLFSIKDVYNLSDGDYIEFDFVKAEIGDCYTGMPSYDASLELNKCRRFYQSFPINERIIMMNASGTVAQLMLSTSVAFYKKPTVVNTLSLQLSFDNVGDNISTSFTKYTVPDMNGNDILVQATLSNPAANKFTARCLNSNGNLCLDAEIY